MSTSERLMVPENRVGIPFPQETKDKMIRKGWNFFSLSKRPIKLPDVGQTDFWKRWDKHYPDPDGLTKVFAEVAISPEFFLPDTIDKLPDEQGKILAERNNKNKRRGFIEDVGSALDYAIIASVVYRETGKNLFYQNKNTRTTTVIEGTGICIGGPDGPTPSSPSYARNVGVAPIAIPFNSASGHSFRHFLSHWGWKLGAEFDKINHGIKKGNS